MQIKFNTRWYVDPIMVHDEMHMPRGYGLYQTSSAIAIAYFPDLGEAQWVCHKLNTGRQLCLAMRNALNLDDWLGRAPHDIALELQHALNDYMRGND